MRRRSRTYMIRGMYALYDKNVKAKDRHKVTHEPKVFFTTRKKAERFIKKHKIREVKILKV